MAEAAPSTMQGRRSWHGGSRSAVNKQSRAAWRWLLSAMAVLLLAIGIYWAWPRPAAKILFLTLQADRAERLTIAPVPFLKDAQAERDKDQEALESWASAARVYTQRLLLKNIESPAQLVQRLASAQGDIKFGVPRSSQTGPVHLQEGDTLVIYVRAHGVALDRGTDERPDVRPLLIKSLKNLDFRGDWIGKNSIDVKELLQQLASMKLKNVKKVVILDCVHVNYDPRIGLVANHFPQAVSDSFPERAKDLWVVLAGQAGELSTVVHDQQRSALNVALLESLVQSPGSAKRLPLGSLVDLARGRIDSRRVADPAFSFWQSPSLLPQSSDPAGQPSLPMVVAPKDNPDAKAADQGQTKPGGNAAPKSAASPRRDPPWSSSGLLSSRPAVALAAQPQKDSPTSSGKKTDKDGAKVQTAASDAEGAPPAGKDDKKAAVPPATDRADVKSGAAAPSPAPVAAPTPAPAPAAAAPAADPLAGLPSDVRKFRAALQEAWKLRDELESRQPPGSRLLVSPIHFAPQAWRELEGLLVSYDERLLYGDVADHYELDPVRRELYQLNDLLEKEGAATTGAPGLSGSYSAFLSGTVPGAAVARNSLAAGPRNRLQEANVSLRIYADAAYRLPDYVRLHGFLASVPDGGPGLAQPLRTLMADLRRMRSLLVPSRESAPRADQALVGDLAALAESIQATKKSLDDSIVKYAQDLAAPAGPLSPGRELRIRLLLQSPLLRAPQRQALYQAMVPQPNAPATAKPAGSAPSAASGAAWPSIAQRTSENLDLFAEMLRTLGAAGGDEQQTTLLKRDTSRLIGILTAPARGDSGTNLTVAGKRLSEFLQRLPGLMKQEYSLRDKQKTLTAVDQFQRYQLALLVDGRDAGKSSADEPLASLAQPLLPEEVPDRVLDFKFAADEFPLWGGNAEQGKAVKLAIELESDRAGPYPVELSVAADKPGDVRIFSADGTQELVAGRAKQQTLMERTGEIVLRVKPLRIHEGSGDGRVRISARVKFGDGEPKLAQADCLLPKPDDVAVYLVPQYAAGRPETWDSGGAFSLMRIPGGKDRGTLLLFPNRKVNYQLLLRNLSREKMDVQVRLYSVPASAVGAAGRIFDRNEDFLEDLKEEAGLLRKDGVPPAQRWVLRAQSDAKKPVPLLPGEPAPTLVEFAPSAPPGAAAAAAAPPPPAAPLTATGGLVCVISRDGHEPIVKWIELAPYEPDELYQIVPSDEAGFVYSGGRLSFQVGLKDPDLAKAMGLTDKAAKVQWDRAGFAPVEGDAVVGEISATNQPLKLAATVRENQSEHIVQLHIDGYPRAMIYRVRLDGARVASVTNLKKDLLQNVHLSRISFLVDGKERKRISVERPLDDFTLASPAVGENLPPDLEQGRLTRGTPGQDAVFKLGQNESKIRMQADLQADVVSQFFARGGRIAVSLAGQQKYFYRDRQMMLELGDAAGPTLPITARMDDFLGLPFEATVDPPADLRTILAAELDGDRLGLAPAPQQSHRLSLIFDRNAPTASIVSVEPREVSRAGRPVIVEIEAGDGNGSGVAAVNVLFGIDKNNNGKLDGEEPFPPVAARRAEGRTRFVAALPEKDGLENGKYLIKAQAVDRAGLVSAPAEDRFSVNLAGPAERRPSGPKAKSKKDDEKSKDKASR